MVVKEILFCSCSQQQTLPQDLGVRCIRSSPFFVIQLSYTATPVSASLVVDLSLFAVACNNTDCMVKYFSTIIVAYWVLG